MVRLFGCGLTVYLLLLAGPPVWAADHVVSPGKSIQAAIDAAEYGDRVIVSPGTYQEYLNFAGKSITLLGDPCDPCQVVLDGAGLSSANSMIMMIAGEDANAVVDGFTITGGRGYSGGFGGGIIISDASPTIRNCRIINNRVTGHGAGIYLEGDCRPVFENCLIADNEITRPGKRGGGLYSNHGILTFNNCEFRNNSAGEGGGICLYNEVVAYINNCVFAQNEAETIGGGIYCLTGMATVTNSRFTANKAGGSGGALAYRNARAKITNSAIHANTARNAAGIYLDNVSYAVPEIYYCTIIGNAATVAAGGLRCINGSDAQLRNCIVYYNTPNQVQSATSDVGLFYCDIQGGVPGDGNFDADPCFVEAWSYGDPNLYEAQYAFRIDADLSPCVDAGDPNLMPKVDDVDIDGQPRFCGLASDVGVDETSPAQRVRNITSDIWYVKIDDAIAQANNYDELVVNPGRYCENVLIDKPLTLRSVQPAFADCIERTVIDAGLPVDPCDAAAVTFAGTDPCRAVLAGFTITGGRGFYDLGLGKTIGGGVYVDGCEALISHCVLKGNRADSGAAAWANASAKLMLSNSVIVDNAAADAAVYAAGQCEVRFCTVKDNESAAIALDGPSDVRNSIFWNNTADPNAAAEQILVGDSSDINVNYCLLEGGWNGAGQENLTDDPLFDSYLDDNGTPADPCDDFTVEYDYQLKSSSPCINYGQADYQPQADWTVQGDYDFRGQDRTTYCRVDIGAYEVVDVNPFAFPGVASTLLESYCTIQEALDNAPDNTTVTVGLGRFVENVIMSGKNVTLRSRLPNDADCVAGTIIDGSDPCMATDPCQPNPIYGSTVTIMPVLGQNAIIRGLTLTGGIGYFDDNGTSSDPNDDFFKGGAVFSSSNAAVVIDKCRIVENTADMGGGIYIYDASSVNISDSHISQNALSAFTGSSGGGVRLSNCTNIIMSHNLITANSAATFGGGLYATECSDISIEYCVFHLNGALGAGFDGSIGGGLRFYDSSNVSVCNSIVWDNYPDGLTAAEMTNLAVTYCDIQDGFEGLGNISADPCFVEPGYWDANDTPETTFDDFWLEGDYHLLSQAVRRKPTLDSPADINADGRVNLIDYVWIAESWLDQGDELSADFDGSRQVDIVDLTRFAADFLLTDCDAVTSPCIDAGKPNRSVLAEDFIDTLCDGQNLRVNMGLYGNTSEAAAAPYGFSNFADITNDGFVDLQDWAAMSGRFGGSYEDNPSDLDRNGRPSLFDALIIADNWLWSR